MMNCSYNGIGLTSQYGYRINGPFGDPDIRRENRYCNLPAPSNMIPISDSNCPNAYDSLWTYGTGHAYPIGFPPLNKRTGCILNNKRYVIPKSVYLMPVGTTTANYLESEFDPPLVTPEQAKLIQGSQTLGNR
jgi:hypothetical protein